MPDLSVIEEIMPPATAEQIHQAIGLPFGAAVLLHSPRPGTNILRVVPGLAIEEVTENLLKAMAQERFGWQSRRCRRLMRMSGRQYT